MSSRAKSAESVKIDIQDIIVGKTPIPHHIELGYPTPLKDQLVDVRAIDVRVDIRYNEDKVVSFFPGLETSNIECITYSCILLNDMIDIEDLKKNIPSDTKTVTVHIDEWVQRMASDNLPEHWFLSHRNQIILQVNIEVIWGIDNMEPLHIEAGTDWADLVEMVQKRAQLLELARSSEVRDQHIKREKKDYSGVHSMPLSNLKPLEVKQEDRDLKSFINDAGDIFS